MTSLSNSTAKPIKDAIKNYEKTGFINYRVSTHAILLHDPNRRLSKTISMDVQSKRVHDRCRHCSTNSQLINIDWNWIYKHKQITLRPNKVTLPILKVVRLITTFDPTRRMRNNRKMKIFHSYEWIYSTRCMWRSRKPKNVIRHKFCRNNSAKLARAHHVCRMWVYVFPWFRTVNALDII